MYQLRLETSRNRSVLGEDKVFLSFPALVQELRDQLDCHMTGESLHYVITHTSWDSLNQELVSFLKKSGIEIRDTPEGYTLHKRFFPPFSVTTGAGELLEKFLAKGNIRWSGFLTSKEYDRILRWKLRRSSIAALNPFKRIQSYSYDSSLHTGRFNTNHKNIKKIGSNVF